MEYQYLYEWLLNLIYVGRDFMYGLTTPIILGWSMLSLLSVAGISFLIGLFVVKLLSPLS